MCGVLGLFHSRRPAGPDLVEGLIALQHRGQDSAGILTSDVTFHLKKGNGTVARVFNEKNLGRLAGRAGIGHVRYPTIGPGAAEDAQPFYVNHPFGVAMVHNGNVTNYFALRRELEDRDLRQLTSFSDLEAILNVFARELAKTRLPRLKPAAVFKAVQGVFRRVRGAYSVAAVIHGQGLLAFRDPHGIKPLVFGRRGPDSAVASESVALDRLGFRERQDVGPGSAVFVDCRGRVHCRRIRAAEPRLCIFEYVYFARPDSTIDGIEVYEARLRLGERLAAEVRSQGVRPDVIVPIPDTARAAAAALSRVLGVELREGLIKNRYIARTFIMPGQSNRALSVRQKLNPVRSQVAGRDVMLVDDSIVRGTTSREIVQMVRDAGARRVFLAVTAPPLRFPCVYGIDMMTRGEFIAKGRTVAQIRRVVGCDALVYQSYDGLVEAVRGADRRRWFCTACFNGEYPTGINRQELTRMEADRTRWAR
ncbi:amidophosphoribosyltransferase, partial [candidate division WOR-3 bacterium]|nr:amidophosphoribosyltransferase [candidate division WOR-3 bacterium]